MKSNYALKTGELEKMSEANLPKTRYFVMKCANITSLEKCIQSRMWAYRMRDKPPQPGDILREAHEEGHVTLIFSVNVQHGWHGYCESKYSETYSIQSDDSKAEESMCVSPTQTESLLAPKLALGDASDDSQAKPWFPFPVNWLLHYTRHNANLCLDFKHTTHLHLNDGTPGHNANLCLDFKHTNHLHLNDGTPVNKARNWQELSHQVGKELCMLMKQHLDALNNEKREQPILKQPESFLKNEKNISVLRERDTWQAVMDKVKKELGPILLACPFGSQRYNCTVAESDLDIFIVYQAKTVDVLGLDPPKQTIKNSHHEEVDYSVLELQRYCELLVKGDAKCVETLFLLDTPAVVEASASWRTLCQHRHALLNSNCLDKYMKEIQGTTGLKQLHRWKEENPLKEQLTPKLVKLSYIILRLLQTARDIAENRELQVYRDVSSTEREELVRAREGNYTYTDFISTVDRYLGEINQHKHNVRSENVAAKLTVQDWLLQCRLQDLNNSGVTSRPVLNT